MCEQERMKSFGVAGHSSAEKGLQRIGQTVPLHKYWIRGQRPVLMAVEYGLSMLRYPDGSTMLDVPIDDLLDDQERWKYPV